MKALGWDGSLPSGGYTPYYVDPLSSLTSNWTSNGTGTTSGGYTSTDANGGSLISTLSPPGGGSLGEVQAIVTLPASGGNYTAYMMATSNAKLASTSTGSFYAMDLQSPTFSGAACSGTLVLYKVVSGSVTSLGSTSVPCHSGMVLRLAKTSSSIYGYVDSVLYFQMSETSLTSGAAGLGVRGAPSGNNILQAQLGGVDTTAPTAIPTSTVATSVYPNQVDFHWKGTTDNSGGTGIARYCVVRSSGPTQCSRTVADLTDATVAASSTYTYTLQAIDFHGNVTGTNVTVTTPASGTIDPRRVGMRSTGAYWGGSGENIDVRSGNLSFAVPLLKAQGRGGSGLAFNLIYNSQNWRQDGSTTWNLGEDVGYGYGWKLMAGSLTPVWGNFAIDHYTFTDASGAEYRLNVNTGGVWTSTDAIYVNFDSNTNRLYFNDGSFWLMGCVSGGTEADAGVMYPTMSQDTNGNQILIRYAAGNGLVWGNSSSRVSQIEDVRVITNGATYSFGYNTDAIPHLTSITNSISTSEGYTFTYSGSTTLSSPFGDPTAFDPVNRLTGMSMTGLGLGYTFAADASGQLTQVTFPYGAYLKWAYTAWNYSSSRKQMEVTSRIFSKDGTAGAEKTYPFTHSGESNSGTNPVHTRTDLDDPSGNGGRTWYFNTSGSTIGLLGSLERYNYGSSGRTVAALDSYTWTQDAANRWYVGSTTSSADGTVVKKTAQTLDAYGNLTQMKLYDGSGLTLIRTYETTFMSPPSGTYIRNRPYQSFVSVDGTTSKVTLATYTYDSYPGGTLTDTVGIQHHDSSYGTTYYTRGNPATKVDPSGTSSWTYDIAGNVKTSSAPTGTSTSVTYNAANYTVPSAVTTGSFTESSQFNTAFQLTQDTGPNGDTSSIVYDTYARPASTTSKTGAVTYFFYAGSAPWTVTAVTNGKYSRKTLDGMGRPIKVETGTTTGTNPSFTYSNPVSIVETTYDPCGCSPMGKTSAVSMPHAYGASAVWTTYTYDGLGRTTQQTPPSG